MTFPLGFHKEANLGWNTAEAMNFATSQWVSTAKRQRRCIFQKICVYNKNQTVVFFLQCRYQSGQGRGQGQDGAGQAGSPGEGREQGHGYFVILMAWWREGSYGNRTGARERDLVGQIASVYVFRLTLCVSLGLWVSQYHCLWNVPNFTILCEIYNI